MTRFAKAWLVVAGLALPSWALAQDSEIAGFFGGLRSSDPAGSTFGLSLNYTRHFGDFVSGSLSYVNEGHVPSHHRDGIAAQLWLRTPPTARGFSLAAGYGPYRYFDTVPAANPSGYSDLHGWGRIMSLAATWRPARSALFYELRYNRILLKDGMDTKMLLAGIGYRLDRDEAGEIRADTVQPRNELTLYRGRSIVNSFESETATAWSAEYRREFGTLLRGSVAWLDEGPSAVMRRKGVAAQAWLEPSFSDDRFTLGVGIGPYIASDQRRPGSSIVGTALLSFTASINFTRHFTGRVTLSRVHSGYDRDSDVLLAGLGYRF